MDQLTLEFERLAGVGLCAFGVTGEDWNGPHHCERCAAHVEDACREFAAMVARGEYDEQGYTPAERKAQARRVKAQG